jgi:glyoxylase-like metal-dependent hydrolase (beta-lactamase superfamily II)
MSVERSAGRLIGGAQHDHERPRALAVLAQQRQCPLRVIATPGHTPGHISLIDVRDGTLLAGDAVSTIGRTAVSGDLVWRCRSRRCRRGARPTPA